MASIITAGGSSCLYVPSGYAARKFEFGSTWTKLNVGFRFKQKRVFDAPASQPGAEFYFGLCAATTNPIGATTPDHFVGITTGVATWLPHAESSAAFRVGYKVVSVVDGTETSRGSSTAVTDNSPGMIMSNDPTFDTFCVWYLQIEKVAGPQIKVTPFIPKISDINIGTGITVSEDEFFVQMVNSTFSTSESGHSAYIAVSPLTWSIDEATNGYLDSFCYSNNMADITDYPGGASAMIVNSVRVLRLTA